MFQARVGARAGHHCQQGSAGSPGEVHGGTVVGQALSSPLETQRVSSR